MKSSLDFEQVYRRLEMDYQGLTFVFHLDLSCADVNRFKRFWFIYLYLRDLESQQLQEQEKLAFKRKRPKVFLKEFLKETLWAQERIVSLVSDYLRTGKIILLSQIRDKNGCVLNEKILRENPYFYELLVSLAQRLSIWEETINEPVKKKPFWHSWFA